MRRRRLMCESRKEQSDGIAIATKSIASSALPVGLCRRQMGETREEGGHILDMQSGDGANFATYACKIIPPSPFRTVSCDFVAWRTGHAYFIHNCEHSEQYNWRSKIQLLACKKYNCHRQYNFLLARNITARRAISLCKNLVFLQNKKAVRRLPFLLCVVDYSSITRRPVVSTAVKSFLPSFALAERPIVMLSLPFSTSMVSDTSPS